MNFKEIFNRSFLKDFAITCFAYIAFLFLVTTLVFFLGISISSLHFYILTIAFILLNFIYFKGKKRNIKVIILNNILVFLNLAISLLIASLIIDASCDGQVYHQEALIQLANGWNPFKTPIINNPHSIWISHYGKLSWIVGAIFYAFTNSIETAKGLNLFLLLPTFSYAYTVIVSLNNKRKLSTIIAFIILLSPTAINQTFTSYVDGLVYITFVIILLAIVQLLKSDENKIDHYIILSSGILLLSNIKFTGLGYAGLLMLCYVIYKIYRYKLNFKTAKPLCTYFVSIFIVAVFITGFNPYITNLKMGHPFYPLSGPDKVDIMTNNTPEFIRDKNIVQKFIGANYGVPGIFNEKQLIWQNSPEELASKFIQGLELSYAYDLAVGGFGPLTSVFITFIFISSIYLLFKLRNEQKTLYKFILIAIGLTIIINPECWWARYVPQIWLLLCMNIFFLFTIISDKKYNFNKILGSLMIVFVILSSSFPLYTSLSLGYKTTQRANKFYEALRQEAEGKTVKVNWGWYNSTRIKFMKNNINYEEADINADTPNVKPIELTNGYYIIE